MTPSFSLAVARNCIEAIGMKHYIHTCLVALACVALGPATSMHAQLAEANLPDSPTPAGDTANPPPMERETNWRTLPRDFLEDQKEIWLFPVKLAKGHHWVPTLAVAGGTAALIAADPHVASYFRSHARNVDKGNDVFDPMITTGEIIAVPASLMAAGYLRHDSYQVDTALMAAGPRSLLGASLTSCTFIGTPSEPTV